MTGVGRNREAPCREVGKGRVGAKDMAVARPGGRATIVEKANKKISTINDKSSVHKSAFLRKHGWLIGTNNRLLPFIS